MSKPSQKKIRKQRTRKQEAAVREQDFSKRRSLLAQFPSVRFQDNGAPQALVEAVRKEVKAMLLAQETVFEPHELEWFKMARTHGFPTMLACVGNHPAKSPEELGTRAQQLASCKSCFETRLYDRLPNGLRDAFFPINSVECLYGKPRLNEIQVRFSSLKAAKTKGGTAYYSRTRPQIAFDGKNRLVAFSGHAIERIGGRCLRNPTTYSAMSGIFCLLDVALMIEVCVLPREEPALKLFMPIPEELEFCDFSRSVLGDDWTEGATYAFVAGYCPIVFEADLAVAKTFLLPGMSNTPESRLFDVRNVDLRTLKRLKEKVDQQLVQNIFADRDYELTKWMHQQGEVQLVRLEGS